MTPDTAPEAITQAEAREIIAQAFDRNGRPRDADNVRKQLDRLAANEGHCVPMHLDVMMTAVSSVLAHRRLTSHSAGEGLREALSTLLEQTREYLADAPVGHAVHEAIERADRLLLTPPSDAGSTTRSGGEGLTRANIADALHRVAKKYGDLEPFAPPFLAEFADAVLALATTLSPDASPDSGDKVEPDHRAHLAFDSWSDRHPDAPAYWFRLPSWVQDFATECVRATERRLARPSPFPAIVKEAEEVERPNDAWKEYEADFNAMTDEEIEEERQSAQNLVDEQESWLEAVASWEAVGKPRAALSASNAAQVSK